jgi:hypothetical protein
LGSSSDSCSDDEAAAKPVKAPKNSALAIPKASDALSSSSGIKKAAPKAR